MAKHHPSSAIEERRGQDKETRGRRGKSSNPMSWVLAPDWLIISWNSYVTSFLNRSNAGRLMPTRKPTNSHSDKVKSIKPTKYSMTVKIRSRHFTPRCSSVTSTPNNSSKSGSKAERSNSIEKSTCSGKSLRSKRCLSTTSAWERSSRRSTTRRCKTPRASRPN